MNWRLMKPRLGLPAPTALVITRAWYCPDTAIRPPCVELSTLICACCDKNATSSSNVLLEPGGIGEGIGEGVGVGVVGLAALLGAAGDWQESTSALRLASTTLRNHPLAIVPTLAKVAFGCRQKACASSRATRSGGGLGSRAPAARSTHSRTPDGSRRLWRSGCCKRGHGGRRVESRRAATSVSFGLRVSTCFTR